MNTNETLTRDDLLTDCERSVRYHMARARFYNSLHLRSQFLIFTFASASIFDLLVLYLPTKSHLVLFAVVSLLALLNLVYDPAAKANLHRNLHRNFTQLNGDIMAKPDADDSILADWTRKIYRLYADEPPEKYRALLAHCDNQVAIQLDKVKDGYFVDLRFYHRWLRNLFTFQSVDFPNRNQADDV